MAEIAWLGMYDHPGQHAANDALWAGIAEDLRLRGVRGVPARLTRGVGTGEVWSHPGLLLGMICTRPWALAHDRLRLLGHPVYAGTATPGTHRSRIVVRRDDPARALADLRGRRVAINDAGSNTGMALLRDRIAPLAGGAPFFAPVIETGAHARSAEVVAGGRADVAAIDEVTFAALARFAPDVTGALRTLDWSAPAATPAFVTAATTPPEVVARLRSGLDRVLADPVLAEARAVLGLTGIVPSRADLRAHVARQDAAAAAAGYPALA
ncbi:phosphate/phosphite/phosphonate ABC transporter substrate-binding protein [Sphingomonas silueang]|uniref:phosphate/phosphite/phosphonate ABC transporter substrate-binding protein n=1 Tax=Sphingomonas silueang TaxID=3156617 RepID=UPI0032B371E1